MSIKSSLRFASEKQISKEQGFWDSFARHYDRFMKKSSEKTYEILFNMLKADTLNSRSLLEVGTGTGTISLMLSKYISHINAIDISPVMIDIARAKADHLSVQSIILEVGDACELSFPDNTFDTIIASNILHLLVNPDLAMQEMKRVLRNNGKIIIPTYCHGENLLSHIFSRFMSLFGFGVRTRWSIESFDRFIQNCGFVIVKSNIIKGSIPMSYVVAELMTIKTTHNKNTLLTKKENS